MADIQGKLVGISAVSTCLDDQDYQAKAMKEGYTKNQSNTSLSNSVFNANLVSGSLTLGGLGFGIDNSGWASNSSIGQAQYICQHCGQSVNGYAIHSCIPRLLNIMQAPPTSNMVTKMNKDTLVVYTEQGGFVTSTDKDLDAAKQIARDYTNKNKARCFILKPIWNCAPKTDLVESEL